MIDYIKKRCEELKMTNYAIKIRLMILEPLEVKNENLHFGEFWVIDNPNTDFGILLESDKGYFGEFGKKTNDNTLEHSGRIKIDNITHNRQTLQFWQVLSLNAQ